MIGSMHFYLFHCRRMITPNRKFLSEHAVNLYTARWIGIAAHQLNSDGEMDAESADVSKQCHIYLICRKPASSVDPASFSYRDGVLRGNLIYRLNGFQKVLPFESPFNLSDRAVRVAVSPYPHREIHSLNTAGEMVRYVPANILAMAASPVFRDLEVLYVGQAFAEGRRTAVDRLKSHSTLQKILADMQYNRPDDEVIILAFEYLPYRIITSMDGTAKKAIAGEQDSMRFSSILDNPLTEHQQICLAEAALIRYFRPRFNEIYRDSFPSADQKILNECFQLDFSALIVEINTEELRCRLYSDDATINHHHIAKFDLVDPTKRRSFFTFIASEGASTNPDVIQLSRLR